MNLIQPYSIIDSIQCNNYLLDYNEHRIIGGGNYEQKFLSKLDSFFMKNYSPSLAEKGDCPLKLNKFFSEDELKFELSFLRGISLIEHYNNRLIRFDFIKNNYPYSVRIYIVPNVRMELRFSIDNFLHGEPFVLTQNKPNYSRLLPNVFEEINTKTEIVVSKLFNEKWQRSQSFYLSRFDVVKDVRFENKEIMLNTMDYISNIDFPAYFRENKHGSQTFLFLPVDKRLPISRFYNKTKEVYDIFGMNIPYNLMRCELNTYNGPKGRSLKHSFGECRIAFKNFSFGGIDELINEGFNKYHLVNRIDSLENIDVSSENIFPERNLLNSVFQLFREYNGVGLSLRDIISKLNIVDKNEKQLVLSLIRKYIECGIFERKYKKKLFFSEKGMVIFGKGLT